MDNIIIDRYQLKSLLGQGGMGRTYEAIDLQTQQSVAIKIISLRQVDDWKKVELIEREAQILQKLNHPNIPKYLDYFTIDTDEDKSFYLVQQLVKGKSLDIWRQEKKNISQKRVKKIIRQVLRILIYLHNQTPPIIHRDIKPQNILINKNERIYLVDFGAVQNAYYNTIVSGNTVVGTYGYMSVEQSIGKVTPASDLYSLGATILYLLTNRSPHELDDDNFQIDVAKCLKDTNISDEFVWWLEKMLALDLDDRFNNATQALQAINNSYVVNHKKDRSQFVFKGWRNILIISIIILVSGSMVNKYKWSFLSRLGYYPPQMCRSIDEPAKTLIDYLNSGGQLDTIIEQIHTNPNCLASLIRHKEDKIIDRLLQDKKFDLLLISPSLFKMLTLAEDVEKLQHLVNYRTKPRRFHHLYDKFILNNYDIKELKSFINNGGSIKTQNHSGDTLLHLVKDIEKAKLLIDNGADVNAQNDSKRTPLHLRFDKSYQFEMAKLLLDNGANVHIKDIRGNTPLHLSKNAKVTQLLINNGADVNVRNNQGNTPLHTNYNHEIIKLLIDNGANVNAQNKNGDTPLHKIKHNKFTRQLVIDSGADVNIKNNEGKTSLQGR